MNVVCFDCCVFVIDDVIIVGLGFLRFCCYDWWYCVALLDGWCSRVSWLFNAVGVLILRVLLCGFRWICRVLIVSVCVVR